MFETATIEVDVLGISDLNSSISTTQPTLIVELVVVLAVFLWTEFIGLGQKHASLQGYMPFLCRPPPRGVAEGDTFDCDVAYRMICCADYLNKGFKHGIDGSESLPICCFMVTCQIIELLSAEIIIPFSRLVEQFFGIGEIER